MVRTLGCGQTFRWVWRQDAAEGVVGRSLWRLRPCSGGVEVEVVGEPVRAAQVRSYLLAWGPLEPAEAKLRKDRVLARVLPYTRGISILRQDPWEVLASFLVSQNNNIPKIARSVAYLCAAVGEPISSPPVAWTFPSAERLAEAPQPLLQAAGLGYRTGYLQTVARRVADGEVEFGQLRRWPTSQARQALLDLPGVGEKVADCVLLFGLGHRQVFPVDVWVRRAVQSLYFRGRPLPDRAIRAWALERFGSLSGLVQQHLYHYARTSWRTGQGF